LHLTLAYRCEGTTHIVQLKEEVLVGEEADVLELEEDNKFHRKMERADIASNSRCSFEGTLQDDPESQVRGRGGGRRVM
jgi:hypothetical protein